MPPHRRLRGLTICLPVISALLVSGISRAEVKAVDEATGFVIDRGWELANAHCAACHSAQIVTQNRMDRNGWEDTIRQMQAEHGLWDLGEAELVILDYLTRHYGITDTRPRIRKKMLGSE